MDLRKILNFSLPTARAEQTFLCPFLGKQLEIVSTNEHNYTLNYRNDMITMLLTVLILFFPLEVTVLGSLRVAMKPEGKDGDLLVPALRTRCKN